MAEFDREKLITEAKRIRAAIEAISNYAPDNLAVENKLLYPVWVPEVKVYDDKDLDHPQSKMRGPTSGLLYKCKTSHTTQGDWPPEITPTLWTVIDEAHAGTKDDPIPAARGMEYTYGLYYRDPEDGKLYICKRTGEEDGGKVELQFLPHELLNQYFEEVTE